MQYILKVKLAWYFNLYYLDTLRNVLKTTPRITTTNIALTI